MNVAICSGSFDPITLGHLDIIRRAAAIFERVYVCVSPNAEKRGQMFTARQKLALVKAAVEEIPGVEAELYDGLLSDYAKMRGGVIVRGVRNGTDYDAEAQMTHINRGIHPEVDTLLLPASPAYQHFSSTMAREMIRYRQPLEHYLPAGAIPLVLAWTQTEKENE